MDSFRAGYPPNFNMRVDDVARMEGQVRYLRSKFVNIRLSPDFARIHLDPICGLNAKTFNEFIEFLTCDDQNIRNLRNKDNNSGKLGAKANGDCGTDKNDEVSTKNETEQTAEVKKVTRYERCTDCVQFDQLHCSFCRLPGHTNSVCADIWSHYGRNTKHRRLLMHTQQALRAEEEMKVPENIWSPRNLSKQSSCPVHDYSGDEFEPVEFISVFRAPK